MEIDLWKTWFVYFDKYDDMVQPFSDIAPPPQSLSGNVSLEKLRQLK